jgi:predicted TPR repeat methyltransferase
MTNPITIEDQDITKSHKQRNLKSIYLTEQNAIGYREYDDKPYDQYAIKFGEKITEICESYNKKIRVLDIACGTGRHFHRLRKVNLLHGVDFSMHMLERSKSPTRISELTWWDEAEEVKLFCNTADDFCRNSKSERYDFVYSIGAIAEYGYPEGIIATKALFNNMARSLARGGTMMFTVHEQNFTTEQIKEYLKSTLISKMTVEYEEVSFGDWSHTIVTARS